MREAYRLLDEEPAAALQVVLDVRGVVEPDVGSEVTSPSGLSCQEQMLPAETLQQKWDAASSYGFEAVELRGQGGHRLRQRVPELLAAQRDRVVIPTVCVEMDHFIGDSTLTADATGSTPWRRS